MFNRYFWLMACLTVLFVTGCASDDTTSPAEVVGEDDDGAVEPTALLPSSTEFKNVYLVGTSDGNAFRNNIASSSGNDYWVFARVDYSIASPDGVIFTAQGAPFRLPPNAPTTGTYFMTFPVEGGSAGGWAFHGSPFNMNASGLFTGDWVNFYGYSYTPTP